jgi:hypothetical protein
MGTSGVNGTSGASRTSGSSGSSGTQGSSGADGTSVVHFYVQVVHQVLQEVQVQVVL